LQGKKLFDFQLQIDRDRTPNSVTSQDDRFQKDSKGPTVRIHYLQHEDSVSLGSIRNWLSQSGHQFRGTNFQRNVRLPSLDDFDGLIVLGGSMSAYDEATFPWLCSEKEFLRHSIEADKRVLGVCLGAQLIASSLGKQVYRNPHLEVGWFQLHACPAASSNPWSDVIPTSTEVFHWHGDTFDLPDGAIRLASSDACLNQAYAYRNNVVALQFHLETTVSEAQGWINEDLEKLVEGPFTQTPGQMLQSFERFETNHRRLDLILDRFFGRGQTNDRLR
jgi:GMP synthase (glutamine-hydrolysing)